MSTERLRILVVDDSALYRQMICNALREIAGVEVVGIAKDGHDALDKIRQFDPDVITLDFEMPGLDGIQVLRRMSRRGVRSKAIMVSSYTEEGGKVTTDALMEGAFDFVLKPSGGTPQENRQTLKLELLEKLDALSQSTPTQSQLTEIENEIPGTRGRLHTAQDSTTSDRKIEAVVIGASTGGPIVLRQLLKELPGDLPVPLIIVQHMPEQFTSPLARRLNEVSQLSVVETAEAKRVRPGGAFLAMGGKHTKLVRRDRHIITHLTEDPPENSCRPAVDYTLCSATDVYEGNVLAVILTGMGKDGLRGCQYLRQHGGHIIAQHPEDCTVYGMPKGIIDQGLANSIVRSNRMAREIQRIVHG